MAAPAVPISEVGPRDGLQSIARSLPTAAKLVWIDALHAADLRDTTGLAHPAQVRRVFTRLRAAVGSLGGCTYAPGASGNVVTADLVCRFEAMGIATGVGCHALVAARAPLRAGLPGEPLCGISPEAGLPLGFAQGPPDTSQPGPTLTLPSPAGGRGF